jgi:peptidoglycan-N-acetylglucosamine deacetylase
MGQRICLLTNDVETTSIINGGLRPETGIKVWREGIPRLLELYEKYNVKSTFFFVADFARDCPDIVRMIQPYGHEVACHGFTHDYKLAFDVLTYDEQVEHLNKAKKILEDIAGVEVISFRAPALRVNEFTPKALIETGFRYDSSVAPQRMDIFMSLGSKNKMEWLKAPREPYYVSENNLARKGNTGLMEIPVSSFCFPYIGTFMRVSPLLNLLTRLMIYGEARDSEKIVNFLIHPNELIEEADLHLKTERRSANYLSYILSDVIRRKLKLRNLGNRAVIQYDNEIKFWKDKQFEFTRVSDIRL